MNASALFGALKESFAVFWNARDARERTILSSALVALALLLIYAIFIAPALSGRAQLNKDLPALRQQAAELSAMARQASELANTAVPPASPVTQESVAASLTSRGMKAQSLAVTDDMVRIQLSAVSFSGLLDWIDEQQRTTRLTVIEANFIAQPQSDTVNANLTLKQQRSEAKSD